MTLDSFFAGACCSQSCKADRCGHKGQRGCWDDFARLAAGFPFKPSVGTRRRSWPAFRHCCTPATFARSRDTNVAKEERATRIYQNNRTQLLSYAGKVFLLEPELVDVAVVVSAMGEPVLEALGNESIFVQPQLPCKVLQTATTLANTESKYPSTLSGIG